jgi:CRP-like cAMP-binding protein
MNRAEFEQRLREDPEFRERLNNLEQQSTRVQELTDQADLARKAMFEQLVSLGQEGVPLSSLARVVGVTPQRVSAVMKEALVRMKAADLEKMAKAGAVASEENWDQVRQGLQRVEEEAGDEARTGR